MNADLTGHSSPTTPDPANTNRPRDYGWMLFLAAVALLLVAAYFAASSRWYIPGDTIGYRLGLAGGLAMLPLPLYSWGKRQRFMNRYGLLTAWFNMHMALGILGPALIVMHSAFTFRSTNGGVAMLCMLLVTGSGMFGRFVYTRIHYGLRDSQAAFQQLLSTLDDELKLAALPNFVPTAQQKLLRYRERAAKTAAMAEFNVWALWVLSLHRRWLSRRLVRELKKAIYATTNRKNTGYLQLKQADSTFANNKALINAYLDTAWAAAQFHFYERLFSIWHLFHIPLAAMLVLSAAWHILAVHMY